MAVNSITNVSIRGYRGANPVIMTFQYRTGISLGDREAELQALGISLEEDFFTDAFFPPLIDYFPDDVFFYDIQLRDAQDGSIGLDYTFSQEYQGALTGEKYQNDSCMLVLKKTAKIGRFATGKNYLAVGTEVQVSNGLWSQNFRDLIADAMENVRILESSTPAFVFYMCVWSAKYQEANDVTGFRIIPEPRRQKRRRKV